VRLFALIGGLALVCLGLGERVLAGENPILINEIQYHPEWDRSIDPVFQWVELYNCSGQTVDMEGWVLWDSESSDPLPAVTFAPGEFVIIAATDSFRNRYPSVTCHVVTMDDGQLGNGLTDGDALLVVDYEGRLIDEVQWGQVVVGAGYPSSPWNTTVEPAEPGGSIGRRPNGVDSDQPADFCQYSHPTPGETNPYYLGDIPASTWGKIKALYGSRK
jgi:hypothetical protein